MTQSVKSSREPVFATSHSRRGNTRRPTTSIRATKAATLASVMPSVASRLRIRGAGDGLAAQQPGDGGQQDEDEDHGEVLDHEPAHGDAPVHRLEDAAVLERPQQHHGARARQAQPEDEGFAGGPAPEGGHERAQECRRRDLHDGPGDRDAPHRQQVPHRQVQAHAEHEQHHADLGQLARERHVGHEPRRVRADEDPGHEVAHDGRELRARGRHAQDHGEAQAGGDRGDQGDVVGHGPILARAPGPIQRRVAIPRGAPVAPP